jgi:hypothetical protein
MKALMNTFIRVTSIRNGGILAALLVLLGMGSQVLAQTQDLTVVVLVNSTATSDYNTNKATPGTYQMGPERYFVHLQIPYRIIDVSQTAPPDLTTVQLIIAGHAHLSLNATWQNAIATAVQGGTGFVNLDTDPSVGLQSHIQRIFGATGSTVGNDQTSVVVPAAVQVGGATPHYIAALQMHWAGDPAGDITYTYHGNGVTVVPSDATLLTGATGTVVARLGTDPLIIATTFGAGRAVDFTDYDYMRQDRFGFVEGADDLFWRSIVWAARKPFVLRGYPRLSAIQMDDNETGIMSRIPDMWSTTLTGAVASDGTGGPWKPQINMQLSGLTGPGGERAQMITAIQAGQVHASAHGLNYGSGGDLYWNLTVPNTDAQWQANVTSALQWITENGGTDTFPTLSRSMVAHYWDISNNAGYEMYNSLGIRYVTSPQAPGAYYFTVPKTPAQRIPLGPFRIYEQPPIYTGDEEETFPFFFADDLTIGSVSGKPAQTFFAFGSQVGLSAGRFARPDALWPSTTNDSTVAQSLNQWEYYMWRFWSGMAPVQIYTHDGDNLEYSTVADRQSFIKQLSQWFSTNHGQHTFMDNMGDYLRARNHSLLSTASLNSTSITLNFTGAATDADGHLIDTKTYIFYGDNEGTFLDIPGFANGATYSFPNTYPAKLQLDPLTLSFAATTGTSAPSQTITVANAGSGAISWTVTSNAAWLTATPSSRTSAGTTVVSVASSTLAAGTYTGTLTFTATGALSSPQTVPVTLVVATPSLVPSPTSLSFSGTVGGTAPAAQTVAITNPAGSSLTWTASSDSTWLSASVITAGTPGSISVSVVPGTLTLGTYTGNITLTPSLKTIATVKIPVTFLLSGVIDAPSTANLNAWTVSPLGNSAGWTSSGGSIHYNGGGESQLYTGSSTWTDYDLNVNLTLANLSDYPGGIRARVNPATGAGYALWMYPAEHTLTIYSVVNWAIGNGYTTLSSTSNITFDTNPHTLRLSVHGTQISAYFDGVQVLTVADSTYSSGEIALDPSNQPLAYNSVTVNSTSTQPASFSASPTPLSFTATAGTANPPTQTVALTSSPSPVTWTVTSNASWLTASPTSGTTTPGSTSAAVNISGLTTGSYNGILTFTPSAGSPVQVPVTLTLTATSSATLAVTPTTLDIFSAVGSSPPPVTLTVANTGTGSMPWTASSNLVWLTPSPASSSGAGPLTLTPSTGNLPSGNQMANVTVTAPGAAMSPITATITLHLGTLIFSDNFANGSTQWSPSPLGLASNWTVANNAFNYNGNGHTQQYAGSQSWANYIVSTGYKLSNLSNYPGGLRARVNLTSGASYTAWVYPADHVIKLFLTSGWNIDTSPLTLLGTSPVILFDTNVHMLRIAAIGNQITVYYDNTAVITATDSTLPTGAVALDVSSQPVSFSTVSVIQQ